MTEQDRRREVVEGFRSLLRELRTGNVVALRAAHPVRRPAADAEVSPATLEAGEALKG